MSFLVKIVHDRTNQLYYLPENSSSAVTKLPPSLPLRCHNVILRNVRFVTSVNAIRPTNVNDYYSRNPGNCAEQSGKVRIVDARQTGRKWRKLCGGYSCTHAKLGFAMLERFKVIANDVCSNFFTL